MVTDTAPLPVTITVASVRELLASLDDPRDVGAVAAIVDRLEVVRVAARKAKRSLDEQNSWATVKLEAQRQAGSMLSTLRRTGDLRTGRPNADAGSALSALGISQQQSSKWQRLASVSDDDFRAWLAATVEAGAEVTEVAFAGVAARGGFADGGRDGAARTFSPAAHVAATLARAKQQGQAPRNVLLEGDCLEVLKTLPDCSVDAMVTDPPAGISMMGATWDHDRGGRDAWVAWMTDVMREALRVLKPGAHALVWSLPRTSHWTAWALEESGFEIKDSVMHVYLQGMPKSGDLAPSVAELDEAASAEWSGYAQDLKPAYEPWILCRKPTDLSAAANVVAWGTGALNIDATRIGPTGDEDGHGGGAKGTSGFAAGYEPGQGFATAPKGRWPANVVLTSDDDGHAAFDGEIDGLTVEGVVGGGESTSRGRQPARGGGGGMWGEQGGGGGFGYLERDELFYDMGSKSRMFLIPKASRRERDSGLASESANGSQTPSSSAEAVGLRENVTVNDHIAAKPLELIRHFVRLIGRPGGLVLDPFAGSGVVGIAAKLEGGDYLLIDADPHAVEIAEDRLGLTKV